MTRKMTMTLRELVAQAAALLSEEDVDQPSGRVSDIPTVRTVRYYATHGLLEKPVDWKGRTALYGPRHLLTLVAIKRLQARGESLQEVQGRLGGISLEELEALAGLTLDELVSDDEDIEGGESSDEVLRESEDEEEAEEPEEASPRQRSFWMARSVTTADAQSEDEHKEVAPRRPRRESSIIRGIRVEDEVLLLLEGANREVEADDLAAIKAAAEPLLRLLRARHIID